MTINAVERALWLIGNDPRESEKFVADRTGYLQQFRLDPEEQKMIATVDVRRLSDAGVNTLLLLAVQRGVQGGDSIPDYMRQMNTPAT